MQEIRTKCKNGRISVLYNNNITVRNGMFFFCDFGAYFQLYLCFRSILHLRLFERWLVSRHRSAQQKMCSRADTSYPLCLTRIPYSNLIALFNSISISNFYKFSFRSVFLLQLFFQFDSFYICFVFFRAISLSHLHFVSERFLN